MPSTLTAAALAALQGALAAEHAAVYGYGVVGAELSGSQRTQAVTAYQAHLALRDALQREVSAAGAVPVAASAGYELPFPVPDAASAVRLAVVLEERLAGVYANAVQATSGTLRTEAAGRLQDAALRALSWRGSSVPFPGLPERSVASGSSPSATASASASHG
jgi:phage tail sheath gpL-like